MLYTGIILKSTEMMEDPNFTRTTILITEFNDKGATGFITDKIYPRKFNALVEFSDSPPFPLYDGGPVDREHLFFIHRCPQLIQGGIPVNDTVFFGGDFKQAVAAINKRHIGVHDIRLFIGYCGWDAGELEAEIAEGSWRMEKHSFIF